MLILFVVHLHPVEVCCCSFALIFQNLSRIKDSRRCEQQILAAALLRLQLTTLLPAFCSETLCSNDIKVDFSLRTLMFCSSSQLMWHFFHRYIQIFFFLSAFNLYPHFAVHHGGWGWGRSIMCPLTQRNSHFPADFEWVLSCNGPTHPHFFSLQKMGNDKSAEAILSLFHYLFSQYVLITYYLHHWQLL